MTLAIHHFPGGFTVEEQHQVEPTPAAATTDARQLRRRAIDAVAEFRRVVDAADDAMVEHGAAELKGWRLARLQEKFGGPVRDAARVAHDAILAAHLATGLPDFNPHIITDEGDILLLEETEWPLPDEQSFFAWPYVTIYASQAIQPARD